MNDKPKRRWFQIHLSTAVLLMFVASAFVYANTRARLETEYWKMYGDTPLYSRYTRGWPCLISNGTRGREFLFFTGFEESPGESTWSVTKEPPLPPVGLEGEWYLRGILKNLAVLMLALLLIAVCCEYVTRRREARKP